MCGVEALLLCFCFQKQLALLVAGVLDGRQQRGACAGSSWQGSEDGGGAAGRDVQVHARKSKPAVTWGLHAKGGMRNQARGAAEVESAHVLHVPLCPCAACALVPMCCMPMCCMQATAPYGSWTWRPMASGTLGLRSVGGFWLWQAQAGPRPRGGQGQPIWLHWQAQAACGL